MSRPKPQQTVHLCVLTQAILTACTSRVPPHQTVVFCCHPVDGGAATHSHLTSRRDLHVPYRVEQRNCGGSIRRTCTTTTTSTGITGSRWAPRATSRWPKKGLVVFTKVLFAPLRKARQGSTRILSRAQEEEGALLYFLPKTSKQRQQRARIPTPALLMVIATQTSLPVKLSVQE